MAGREVVIVGAARTPIGAFLGSLSSVPRPGSGAVAIKRRARARRSSSPAAVDEVFMGNVLQAGVGQAPARQAAIFAGLPEHRACDDREQGLRLGPAGGHLRRPDDRPGRRRDRGRGRHGVDVQRARTTSRRRGPGARMGNAELVDGMIHDGLWDPYGDVHMGTAARCAPASYEFSRASPGRVRAGDHPPRPRRPRRRACSPPRSRPSSVPQKKGDAARGERRRGAADRAAREVPSLKPAFAKDGTITAANASSINDGATALVLASEKRARSTERDRSPASSATAARAQAPSGSPPRRPTPSRRRWRAGQAHARTTSISGRSTRPSRWSPWPTTSCSGSTRSKVNVRGGAVVARPPHRRVAARASW